MIHALAVKIILPAQILVFSLLASRADKDSHPSTAIPGWEIWSVFNTTVVEITVDEEALILTLTRRALWFMGQRGVLIHQPVSGNFKITADVYTIKESDPSQPPGDDESVQLSGLMIRNGGGGPENYVFIVVGDDGNGLSVETKNTVDNFSKYDGPSWGSSVGMLRMNPMMDHRTC